MAFFIIGYGVIVLLSKMFPVSFFVVLRLTVRFRYAGQILQDQTNHNCMLIST